MTQAFSGPVVIYQQTLMHYRVPLFNRLQARLGRPVIVSTGELGDGLDPSACEFEIRELPRRKFGPFRSLQGFASIARQSSCAILPFDIHESVILRVAIGMVSPAVLWGHSHGSRRCLRNVRRFIARRAGTVVVYTQRGKDALVEEDFDASTVFVANNTVDIANAGFDPTIPRTSFLFSGRLTSRKKVDEAFQAFAGIQSRVSPDIKFEIVGDGPELKQLKELAKRLHIRAEFHGSVFDPDRLRMIFQRSLAFVSPGHVGLAVLHSFAYGIPPLTRRHANHAPEFEHIRDNENGILYGGEIDDLAEKMQNLASSPGDTGLGENAFRYYSAHCTLERAVDGLVTAIQHAERHS